MVSPYYFGHACSYLNQRLYVASNRHYTALCRVPLVYNSGDLLVYTTRLCLRCVPKGGRQYLRSSCLSPLFGGTLNLTRGACLDFLRTREWEADVFHY